MNKQVIKVNGQYAARYKKWYHTKWRYIVMAHSHPEKNAGKPYCLLPTEQEAKDRLSEWFPQIVELA